MKSCDIIIPIYNQPELTKECVHSIIDSTHIPINIILIDNASNSATKTVIKSFIPQENVQITAIENTTNIGFPKAVNQGLGISTAPYVLVLNNDTLFTNNCLETMIDVAQSSPDIGILNPESNTFGLVPYKDKTIQECAQRIQNQKLQYTEFSNCIGFAMLIKREIIEKIGHFDELFGMAFFEDSDYSMRVKEAGYKCVKANGAYIYHYEHKSLYHFSARDALFKKNQRIYYKKWGIPLRIALPITQKQSENQEELKNLFQDIRTLAKNECYIYAIVASKNIKDKNHLFATLNLPVTTNIHVYIYTPFLFWLKTVFRIVKRRKKKYNLILTYDSSMAHFLARCSLFVRYPIFFNGKATTQSSRIRQVSNIQDVISLKKEYNT